MAANPSPDQPRQNNVGKRLVRPYTGFFLAGLIAIIILLALPTLTYPLGRDQGEFATIGRGLLHGRVPYVELWNPKPPAVFYVYALAMSVFGQTAPALRALDLLVVPLIMVGLCSLGEGIANRRVGLWAALVFPVFYFTETFWTLTQNDGLVLLPMVWAAVCAVKAASSHGTRGLMWALISGALTAYAVWFKYPFALFGLIPIAFYLLSLRKTLIPQPLLPEGEGELFRQVPLPEGAKGSASGRLKAASLPRAGFRVRVFQTTSQTLPPLFAFILSGLIVGLGGMAYLASIGAWDALIESAVLTSQYTALTFNWADFGFLMSTAIGYRWSQWGVLWILALLWLVVGHGGHKRPWWAVLLWLAVGLAIMLVQAKGYDYHWLPMLPPLTLLAAGTLDGFWQMLIRRSSRLNPARPIISTLITLIFAAPLLGILAAGIWPKTLPYLTGGEDQIAYYNRFQAGEFIAGESQEVVNLLRERVVPGDSLFIWGFRPEVYYLSGLNPAVRFIFQFPLVGGWYPVEWKQQTVDTLWAALPPYALVLQVDYMPWVTGRNEDSNQLLQEYTELNNWLLFNYEQERQIGNFFLWRRKP